MTGKKVVPKVSKRGVGPADSEMGKRIRLRRVEQGMSQSQLGDVLGVSFQQIQKYEKGVNRVGAARLDQIATALDAPVTFFYGEGIPINGGSNSKQQREVESLLFLDSGFSLRLLRAYAAIRSPIVQRQFVSLMEHVAGIQAVD